MNILNILFTAVSVLLCAALLFPALAKRNRHFRVADVQISPQLIRILAAALFLFAILVRVYAFGSVPDGINQDEAMAAVDAKALSEYGTDRFGMRFPVHFTAWGFGQMSVLMSYLMIPFLKLWGMNSVTIRLPSLLVSLMGLYFLFSFGRNAFSGKMGILFLFLGTVCPWHYMQSRWALDCNLFPHFLMAGTALLYLGITRKPLCLYLSMLFFGLSMYCYGISIYTVPIYLVSLCVYLLVSRRIRLRRCFLCAFLYLLVAWPFILCMILNAFSLESIQTPFFTIPVFPNTIRTKDLLFLSNHFFTQLLSNLKSLFSLLLQIPSDSIFNQISGFQTMYVFSVPFFLLGLILCFRRSRRSCAYSFVLLFFLSGILSCILTNNVNTNRACVIFYPYLMMAGIGISFLMEKILYAEPAIPVMYALCFSLFLFSYFTDFADTVQDTFLSDFGEAVSSLADFDADHYYITADSQAANRSYVSEILTQYYLNIDAKEIQDGSFSQKYSFPSGSALSVDLSENAVYVVRVSDLGLFDSSLFTVTLYRRFAVVYPNSFL